MENKNYTKLDLVREIAFTVGITQKKARFVLDALQFIAYREAAHNGFTIPGICKLDIIKRKERQVRNPQTGEKILIGEHDALRVRVLKKAKDTVTPPPKDLITYLPDEDHAPQIYDDFSKAISFLCWNCKQEIEAPHAAAGIKSECPGCHSEIVIPETSEPGTIHGGPLPEAEPQQPPEQPTAPSNEFTFTPKPPSAPTEQEKTAPLPDQPPTHDPAKRQRIRIDLAALGFDDQKPVMPKRMISFFCKNCRQEIEAPVDMAGSSSECPACGATFEVPFFSDQGTLHGSDLEHTAADLQEIKGRTIRIEVPDDI